MGLRLLPYVRLPSVTSLQQEPQTRLRLILPRQGHVATRPVPKPLRVKATLRAVPDVERHGPRQNHRPVARLQRLLTAQTPVKDQGVERLRPAPAVLVLETVQVPSVLPTATRLPRKVTAPPPAAPATP